MNRDEIRELAAVYALGALDGPDRERFEALLREGDAEAVGAVAEFEATVLALAAEPTATPSAAVREALMARAAAEGGRPAAGPVARSARQRRVLWPALWAAAMAAGLAAIVVALALSARYEERLHALAREASTLQAEVDHQQQIIAILRDPGTEIVALAGLEPAPRARARMIWNTAAGGLLVATGLPPAPAGKTYQLWAIAGKQAPVPAGVFEVGADGSGSLRVPALPGVTRVDVFAVTLEPAGGLPAPSGPMYLAGKS